MAPRAANSAVPPEAVVQFLASALYGLLAWWMDGKMRLSVDEVNDLFKRMAVPAVKAAFR